VVPSFPRAPTGRVRHGAGAGRRDAYARWSGTSSGPLLPVRPGAQPADVRAAPSPPSPRHVRSPHPPRASAVGARTVLIAYNVWLTAAGRRATPEEILAAPGVGRRLRRPGLRTLDLRGAGCAGQLQRGRPRAVPLTEVYDAVARGRRHRVRGTARELVGLLRCPLSRRTRATMVELGLRTEDTIEFRLGNAGLTGRRPARGARYDAVAAAVASHAPRRRRRSRSTGHPDAELLAVRQCVLEQSSRTTHPRQTSFASRVDAPRSGKNKSGRPPCNSPWSAMSVLGARTSMTMSIADLPPLIHAVSREAA